MDRGSGHELVSTTRPSGGGWRALLADVRGDSGSLMAALVAALTDPTDHGRWRPSSLDEAWQHAQQLGPLS